MKSKMRSRWIWILLTGALGLSAYAGTVLATPGSGISTENLLAPVASGQFGEIDAKAETDSYELEVKTRGLSDVYVVRNTFQPGGGHSGWHTHPGPSLITVTSGTISNYSGDDPTCTPQVYSAGMGFVDPGGGHAHLIRNEGSVPAVTVAVQLLPAGAPRRIDVTPAPVNCGF
jgi:quercetin dioxygenase-like cupin family protein